jgi:hypothetical protein
MNPITAAAHFIGKVTLMQKNLSRGLGRGATRLDSKTYPGAPELVILRLIGSIWSTSDFSHPVVAPSILLMGQYLSHGRIRQTSDIASGLMLCSLLVQVRISQMNKISANIQFESESKRFLPEAINFLAGSIVALLPRRKDSPSVPFPDLVAPAAGNGLHISTASTPAELADLATMLSSDSEQSKADLLSTALRLIETVAALYSSSPAFIESFQPMLQVVQSSRTAKLSDALKVSQSLKEWKAELIYSNESPPQPRPSRACSTSPSLHVNPSHCKPTSPSLSQVTHQNSRKATNPASDTTPMPNEMQQASSKLNTSKNEKVLFENYEKTIDSWLAKRQKIKQKRIASTLPRCVVQRDPSLWRGRKRRRWSEKRHGKRDELDEDDLCILPVHIIRIHCPHLHLLYFASYKLPEPNTPLGPAVLTLALFMIPLAGLLPRS